jgi:hypothetical protein
MIDDFDNYQQAGQPFPPFSFCPFYSGFDLRSVWSDASQQWFDQTCNPNPGFQTGSFIDLDYEDDPNDKSLFFRYTNNNFTSQRFSEIAIEFPGGRDFTVGGQAVSLGLSFKGDILNDANEVLDRMYIGLEDTFGNYAIIVHNDPNAQKAPYWQQWNIFLGDFVDPASVDLLSIGKLFIGFGQRGNPPVGPAGGQGLVLFNNIFIYPPRCIPQDFPSPDVTGPCGAQDCIVDYYDLGLIINNWLSGDVGSDLSEDNIVNMEELGMIGESWMQEILWPIF